MQRGVIWFLVLGSLDLHGLPEHEGPGHGGEGRAEDGDARGVDGLELEEAPRVVPAWSNATVKQAN
jgi:hypothetical protein